MLDELVEQPAAAPEKDGQGMVASYADPKNNADNFNPAKIVERWEGELKGVPAPKGFDPAKFNPNEIAKRWEGEAKGKPASKGERVGDEFYQTIVAGKDFKAEAIGGKGFEKSAQGSPQAGLNPAEPRIVQQALTTPAKK